jgi:hypothetical protein
VLLDTLFIDLVYKLLYFMISHTHFNPHGAHISLFSSNTSAR